MQMPNKKSPIILVVVALVFISSLLWFYNHKNNLLPQTSLLMSSQTYVNEKGEKWGPLPQGKIDLQIATAEGQWPKITEATLDPLDVKVGDTQKMIVVIENTADITSVIAEIETDNGIVTVPLERTSVGAVTEADFTNRKFFVRDGILNIMNDSNKQYAMPKNINPPPTTNILSGLFNKAMAQEMVLQKYTYEGSWLVKDTHQKMYHTVFTVSDVLGRKGQITLAWSDAICGFTPSGANASLSSNCNPSGVDGWDGGNVTIPAGTTLTLSGSGVVFAWNDTKNLIINGNIAVGGGGTLKQSYLYYENNDNDLYAQSSYLYPITAGPTQAGYVRKSSGSTLAGFNDCDDSDPNVYPNNYNFYTSARPNGSWDYDCDGSGGTANPAPATGQCDNNSSIPCDGIVPNGSIGYMSPTACGLSGTYVTEPGSACGGGSCITESRLNSCVNATYQYYGGGQCDDNSGLFCDSIVPNGNLGFTGAVPSCGASANAVLDPGNACSGTPCVQGNLTQACR